MKSFLYVAWFAACCMTSCLSSPAADGDGAIEEREPVFRKDYFLDQEQRGWFKLHRIPEKWHDARLRCELEGAELASPLDAKVLQAMLAGMPNLYAVFTGIHSLFSHGDYYSLKGMSVEEMPVTWSHDVSSDVGKRCVELLMDGTINNVKCGSELPFLCYKDNDNAPLTDCGTVDTEYTLNNQLNTCYKLHKEGKTWEDAFKVCSAEGGALTVINSVTEFAAVVQLFNNDTVAGEDLQYRVFVGVVDWKQSGEWITVHGEKLKQSGFSTWSPNEYVTGQDFCGGLNRFGLIRIHCTGPAYFVCEKRPDSLITMDQLDDIMNSSTVL